MHTHSKILQKAVLLGILWTFGQASGIMAAQPDSTPPVGVNGNTAKAADANRAASLDPESLFLKAKALAKGEGVPQDTAAAFELYRKAAEQGHAKAQHNLAVMYYNGVGVTKDAGEAAKWFRKAAQEGGMLSQESLAAMLSKGDGVSKDIKEALHWYQKAAEQGSLPSLLRLGEIYYFGDEGVLKDYAQAARYFGQAADKGNASAQNFLGVIYHFGMGGVPRDLAKAASLYKKAAEQGNAKAQANYGMLFTHEGVVKTDPVEAYKWLKLGADQHEITAIKGLEGISPLMSESQIKEAERKIAEFRRREQKPDGPAEKQ